MSHLLGGSANRKHDPGRGRRSLKAREGRRKKGRKLHKNKGSRESVFIGDM